jgi:hypothetical protein
VRWCRGLRGDVGAAAEDLVGIDHAEADDEARNARNAATSSWFLAFDKIADEIATDPRKWDQLIVTARVRPGT